MHRSEGTCIVEQTQESGSWWTTIAKRPQTDKAFVSLRASWAVASSFHSLRLPLCFSLSTVPLVTCSGAQTLGRNAPHKDSKRGLFCTIIPICESNRDKGAKSIVFFLSHSELPELYSMGRVVCLHHRLTVDPIIHCETPSVTWGAVVGD